MKKTNIISFVLVIVMLFAMTAVSASATLGDLDGDDAIDMFDYMIVKQHVIGTFSIPEEKQADADVNYDGAIDLFDYMILKRHVIGTYVIGSEVDPVVEAIETAIEANEELKSNFTVAIPMAGNDGDASVSFEVIDGVMTLCGELQVSAMNAVVEILIPIPAVSDEYTISGQGNANEISLDISGKLVASEYTVDSPLDITFTAPDDVDISKYEAVLPTLCKNAMNEFLAQADALLADKEVGVDISDLGFEAYYNQLHPTFDAE